MISFMYYALLSLFVVAVFNYDWKRCSGSWIIILLLYPTDFVSFHTYILRMLAISP